MDTDGLPLSDALASLRAELREAIDHAADEDLQFTLGDIQLELQMVVSTKGALKAGGSLWRVLTAEAAVERSSTSTHRVTLTLRPYAPDEPEDHQTRVGR